MKGSWLPVNSEHAETEQVVGRDGGRRKKSDEHHWGAARGDPRSGRTGGGRARRDPQSGRVRDPQPGHARPSTGVMHWNRPSDRNYLSILV
uniref:Uncharacterized protein n=1 Tax=Globodera pallida TaxID=36090 RepID=A0A183BN22_GLOPA